MLEKFTGFQDKKLEVKKIKSTPTTDKDISERARAYKGMLADATFLTMAIEGSQNVPELQEQYNRGLYAIRHDVVVRGHSLDAFDQIVKDNVVLIKKKEKEHEDDWKLINQEFPNQFSQEDFEHQAFRGESPVVDIVNFGNHAFKKD